MSCTPATTHPPTHPQGEGEAAELISASLKANGAAMIEVKRIEAARDIAETLSASRNVVYVPGGGNMLMNLPVAKPAPPPVPLA